MAKQGDYRTEIALGMKYPEASVGRSLAAEVERLRVENAELRSRVAFARELARKLVAYLEKQN